MLTLLFIFTDAFFNLKINIETLFILSVLETTKFTLIFYDDFAQILFSVKLNALKKQIEKMPFKLSHLKNIVHLNKLCVKLQTYTGNKLHRICSVILHLKCNFARYVL